MKAALLQRLGEAPIWADHPEPEALAGDTRVRVEASSIKQLDRGIASGRHYASPKTLPVILGFDGVGRDNSGARVYFSVRRRPFGAFAEVAPAVDCVPVPEALDSAVAAAVVNPALAAWLPLVWRAQLQKGETVLILGATSASGKLAVRAARLEGAGRVIACGRRPDALAALGADATIDLRLPADALRATFAREAARGVGVVVDYVWGPPAEALIGALTTHDLGSSPGERDLRYVQVGAMAGANISLDGGALRGARLTLLGSGTGNFPPFPRMREIVGEIFARAAAGDIEQPVVRRPASEIARVWAEPDSADHKVVLTF